jgi:hypothetical protein
MKHTLTSTTEPTVAGVDMNEIKHNTNQQLQPDSPTLFVRRRFLQATAALGSLAGVPAIAAADDNEPTLGRYRVICNHYDEFPTDELFIKSDAPSMVKTSDGALLCAVPMHFKGAPRKENKNLQFYRSEDGGENWKKLRSGSYFCAGTLFRQGKTLYFMGTGPGERAENTEGFRIIRSEDEGRNWSDPVDLFKESQPYQPAGSYVVRNGQLYWCFVRGWNIPGMTASTYVIAGDLSRDLCNPDAWRISNAVSNPGVPQHLTVGKGMGNWLEGNVVEVNGKLRVCWRYQIDGYSTTGIGALCTVEDDGVKLSYKFEQFHPLPGAQNQFHIVHDAVSRLYWMTATLSTNSQDPQLDAKLKQGGRFKGTSGNVRRILSLYVSFDALNWLPATYIIIWPLLRQSSNYCGLLIDGDDLLVAARTSRNGRDQHDNDLTTFHRVKNFRSFASPLMPRP